MAKQLAARIGERIRERRLELGIETQRELADRLDNKAVTNQHVSNWERGVYRPNDDNLADLARALGVEVSYFMMSPPKPGTPDLMDALNDETQLDREKELRRIEAKLDALLDHFGIKPETIEEIVTDAADDLGLPAGNEDDGRTAAKPPRRRRRAA